MLKSAKKWLTQEAGSIEPVCSTAAKDRIGVEGDAFDVEIVDYHKG
jgi:hypothetical protein